MKHFILTLLLIQKKVVLLNIMGYIVKTFNVVKFGLVNYGGLALVESKVEPVLIIILVVHFI